MEGMVTALLLGGILVAEGTRPFHLGFTRWPADLTIEGVQTASEFALAHGDIVSVMFIGGFLGRRRWRGRRIRRMSRTTWRIGPKGRSCFFRFRR